MKTFLKILSNGFVIIADGYVRPREYSRPSNQDFIADQDRLTYDVRIVGTDIRNAIKKRSRVEYSNKTSSHTS